MDQITSEDRQEGISSLIRWHHVVSGQALDLEKIRPLALAYIGDTLFDLYIRTGLVMTTALHPKQMHLSASHEVNAASQAVMMKLILPDLTEEEAAVFRHARNQHSLSVPKNMSLNDYKWATGMEALLGYLYLAGRDERLYELMDLAVCRFRKEEGQQHDGES